MFKMKIDLTKDPILKSLLIFAFSLFVANVFQQLYNTMDTMIVGNFLGDTSLAAIGACGAIYELLVGFALGVGNGLSIVTARSFGAKDENLLKKISCGINRNRNLVNYYFNAFFTVLFISAIRIIKYTSKYN